MKRTSHQLIVHRNEPETDVHPDCALQFKPLSEPSGGLKIKRFLVNKYKYSIVSLVFMVDQLTVFAQPLPPENPSGSNPVPINGIVLMLLATLVGLGVVKLRKKEKS
jgi:hypothetical protein